MQQPTPQYTLDTKGLTCPEPVMMLHGVVRDAKQGEIIQVVATDPSTTRDIPKFCQFLGHKLIATHIQDDVCEIIEDKTYTKLYVFYLSKG